MTRRTLQKAGQPELIMFFEAQEVARKSNNGTDVNAYYNVEAKK